MMMTVIRNGANTRNHRVPDAVQRSYAAPQSRDPQETGCCMGPGSAAHHAAKGGALRSSRGT
jgi:hypothetical protein